MYNYTFDKISKIVFDVTKKNEKYLNAMASQSSFEKWWQGEIYKKMYKKYGNSVSVEQNYCDIIIDGQNCKTFIELKWLNVLRDHYGNLTRKKVAVSFDLNKLYGKVVESHQGFFFGLVFSYSDQYIDFFDEIVTRAIINSSIVRVAEVSQNRYIPKIYVNLLCVDMTF